MLDKLTKIKDALGPDLKDSLVDEVMDLHLDAGLKMDESIGQHTVEKMYGLLTAKYKNWCWGDIVAVFNMGIVGGYTSSASNMCRINFKTLATWLRKAKLNRQATFARTTIEENSRYKNEKFDYTKTSKNWLPLVYLKVQKGIDVKNPAGLKNAILQNKLTVPIVEMLKKRYPYVFSNKYPITY